MDRDAGTADSVYLLTEKAVVQEIPLDEISLRKSNPRFNLNEITIG